MSWRIWSVRTDDWETKVRVIPSDFKWTRTLNAGAGGSATFEVGDPEVAETANRSTLSPWSRMLVAEYQGLIVYAGFITSVDYDRDTKVTTVTHDDFWAILARRIMVSILEFGVEKTKLIYTGVSLTDLIKQALYQGQNDAARFNLPLVLPADAAGPESRTYDGYQLPTVASVIEDIMDTEDGPDVDFFPRWFGSGQVEWYLRMGNLTDGEWSWDVTAPESQVSGLKERRDGALMANRVVAIGEGSEKKMKIAITDGSATSSFLPLDVATSYKDEKSPTRLAARARADRKVREQPTEQVSMDVQMDPDFAVHELRLGGTVKWHTLGDPYLADGWHESRLIEFSGDLSEKIHLEFQTVGA
jgi:hypothetical protein